jgi:ketosteroid isomerase-like protein
MKILLSILLFLFAQSVIGQAQDKVGEMVLGLDRQRFDAQINKDTTRLKQLLADDLIYVHSSAQIENKKEFVGNVGTARWDYRTAKLEDTRVRVYGNTAIITGKGTLEMFNEGKMVTVRLLYTDVYAQRKGKWQMVSWQSTRLPQP